MKYKKLYIWVMLFKKKYEVHQFKVYNKTFFEMKHTAKAAGN